MEANAEKIALVAQRVEKRTTPAELKARVMAVRGRLPQNVRALILDQHPEYNTAQGGRKINNVLAYASSDERLTEIIEILAA